MSRISPIVELARVPRRLPRVDLVIATALFLWALLEALFVDGSGSTPVRVLLAAGFTLPLAFRRRWPIQVLALVALLALLRGTISGPDEVGAMPFPALLLASFSAALYGPATLSYVAALIPILAQPFAGYSGDPNAGNYLALCFISLTAWGTGFLIRRRASQIAAAHARGPELARAAIAAERARMARELHDVVAHSVTVISMQAGAALELLEAAPEKARGHVEAVRHSAHEALVELRRLVGVLREDEPAYAPQPGLERLDDLLAEKRAAGLDVALTEEGERGSLPAGLDLTAYRIVQEGLTNVRRHAGAVPAQVRLRYGDGWLELEIANQPGRPDDAIGPGSGHGLIGMRERARLYGGTLQAGPASGGGFVVRARLPLEPPPDAAPRSVQVASTRRSGRPRLWESTAITEASTRDGDADASTDPLLTLARVPYGIPRADLAITAGLLAWALIEAVFIPGPGPIWAGVALAAGFTLPMLLRRRFPLAALAMVCLLLSLRGVLFDGLQEGTMPLPVLLLATFSVALYARRQALAMAAAPLPVASLLAAIQAGEFPAPGAVDIATMGTLCGGAWVAGFLIRRRAMQLAEARARGPERARGAVAAERARMARELHDVVAHSITVISVQAGAAEGLLEREPCRARGHLESVGRSAREALVELRRLVGVLREDQPGYVPQPGLDRLDELLAESRASGLPVELVEEGAREPIPAGLDLTAYRIAQESLTNVRRHAGIAPTRLRIRYAADRLELEIANSPGRRNGVLGPGCGHGLIGMRERVRLYGGTLEVGPTPEGGFRVHADLPLEARPA